MAQQYAMCTGGATDYIVLSLPVAHGNLLKGVVEPAPSVRPFRGAPCITGCRVTDLETKLLYI
eukprot:225716-Amphidinium_carterae.1